MSIGKICTNNVVTISENASIQECAKLMSEEKVGCILVVKEGSENKDPIGLITDRDITVKLVSKKTELSNSKVSDIMNTNLLMLHRDEGINKAIEKMRDKGVRRAPIVDNNKDVCGIVSMDDLLVMIAIELNNLADLVKHQVL